MGPCAARGWLPQGLWAAFRARPDSGSALLYRAPAGTLHTSPPELLPGPLELAGRPPRQGRHRCAAPTTSARTFLDYFRRNGHEVVASSPLVPRNDPTLLFTNAGMVQFKNVFTGAGEARPTRAPPPRRSACAPAASTTTSRTSATPPATTPSSRCWATSPSATTSRSRRSSYAWDLLTKEFGAAARTACWSPSIPRTTRRRGLWKKIAGLPDDRIIRIATSDNFWAMGDTGPCGPCSEIFFDHGARHPGRPARQPGRRRRPLHRDLEPGVHAVRAGDDGGRASRCRGPRSTPAWASSASPPSCRASTTTTTPTCCARSSWPRPRPRGQAADGPHAVSHRVDRRPSARRRLPDRRRRAAVERGPRLRAAPDPAPRDAPRAHAGRERAAAAPPGAGAGRPDGRGLSGAAARRAADHARRCRLEETRFRETLERGLRLLAEATGPSSGRAQALPGDVAFKLYDTYGFPLDLTQDIAARRRAARWTSPASTPRWTAQRDARPRGLGRLRRGGDRDAVVRPPRARRRDRVPRLRHRDAEGDRRRSSSTASRSTSRRGRRRGRDRAQPDALLRRVRRPGRATPARSFGADGAEVERARHAEAAWAT